MLAIVCVGILLLQASVHAEDDKTFALKFLKQYNYLSSSRAGNHDVPLAITRYQTFLNLPVTGKLDEATLSEMKKPRCGVADIDDAGRRVNRYDTSTNTKWLNKPQINYYVEYGPDLTATKQNEVFAKAFKYWADVSSLTFYQVHKPHWADIKISFGSQSHGGTSENTCGNPFDGKGGVLAHAYYPEDGRAHFDDAETFTDGTNSGTNLLYVATHEFGHSLGLGHSDVKGTVMWPSYRRYNPNLQLHEDDIAGIRSLYGNENSSSSTGGNGNSGGGTEDTCKDKFSKCTEWTDKCGSHFIDRHCPKSCNVC